MERNEIIMKRLITSIIAIITLFTAAVAYATGPQTDKPIKFSGYSYGETFKNMRSRTRLFCIDYLYGRHSARVVADALDDFAERDDYTQSRKIPSCFFARPSAVSKVAGYDVETELWFAYPFQDGIFRPYEDEAIFYAGVYEFHHWDDLPAIYDDVKGKLITLYGEPYFTGSSLDDVLGPMPISTSVTSWYNSDNAKFLPEYTIWKSSANDAIAVLCFWRETNINENRLRLAYVSNYAEDYFEHLDNLGVFGTSDSNAIMNGMEGL